MTFSWHTDLPVWDPNKQRILGAVAEGVLDSRYAEIEQGAAVPCMWFRAEREGEVIGYGWIDVVWGDAEILLATSSDSRGQGAGTFILEQLDHEARRMGLNYTYNIVRQTHPAREAVTAWLGKRGFVQQPDGRLVRRVGKTSSS